MCVFDVSGSKESVLVRDYTLSFLPPTIPFSFVSVRLFNVLGDTPSLLNTSDLSFVVKGSFSVPCSLNIV